MHALHRRWVGASGIIAAHVLRERARALFCSSCAARSSSWGMLVVNGPPSRASGVGSQNRETSSSQRHSLCRRVSFLKVHSHAHSATGGAAKQADRAAAPTHLRTACQQRQQRQTQQMDCLRHMLQILWSCLNLRAAGRIHLEGLLALSI